MAQGARPRARRVYLVRHGETDNSARHAYSGRADVPLTEQGLEQARQAGERLARAGVDRVVSSPLQRAVDTARAIARATGAPLVVDERITEVDYGSLEGLNRESATERFGDLFRAWRRDPFGCPMPGMEPLGEALERARAATADALRDAECPVLVGHQGILRLVLAALGQVQPGDYFSIRLHEATPVEVAAPRVHEAR